MGLSITLVLNCVLKVFKVKYYILFLKCILLAIRLPVWYFKSSALGNIVLDHTEHMQLDREAT